MQGQLHRQEIAPVVVSSGVMPSRQRSRTGRVRRGLMDFNQILDEPVFRGALARECQKADRFEKSFGLVLVFPGSLTHGQSEWAALLNLLNATAQGTDVVGWFEQDTVIGVIRWRPDTQETVDSLRFSMERDLRASFGAAAVRHYSVRAYLYSPNADTLAAPFLQRLSGKGVGHTVTRWAKRLFDIAGGAALLLAASPVMVAIAAMVKATSSGPVFYRQQRVGEHAKPFNMLKFRTMRVDATHDIHQQFVSQFIQGNAPANTGNGAAPLFKIVADPRVTTIGHFLRRSSLDELPQFWNVLKGDMSLVGPRPPLPYEVKVYRQWHWRRVLEAKPGITGLWQVTGRSQTTFDEMVRLDLRYARSQSLWNDIKILFATPRAVITGKGAH